MTAGAILIKGTHEIGALWTLHNRLKIRSQYRANKPKKRSIEIEQREACAPSSKPLFIVSILGQFLRGANPKCFRI